MALWVRMIHAETKHWQSWIWPCMSNDNVEVKLLKCCSSYLYKTQIWASLVTQWLGICFPMQETQIWSLLGELRFHIVRGNWAHVPQLESWVPSPHSLGPMLCQECTTTRGKPMRYNKDVEKPKIK